MKLWSSSILFLVIVVLSPVSSSAQPNTETDPTSVGASNEEPAETDSETAGSPFGGTSDNQGAAGDVTISRTGVKSAPPPAANDAATPVNVAIEEGTGVPVDQAEADTSDGPSCAEYQPGELRERWIASSIGTARLNQALDDLTDLPIRRFPTLPLITYALEL